MSKSAKKAGAKSRQGLSLHPLSLETALFAALKTGKPAKRKVGKTVKKGEKKNKTHENKGH